MKITEHFSSEEFDCKDGTLYPVEWIESRLKPLCEQLELIRALFGKPITIVSGYRTKPYNTKVGGGEFSQHLLGKAADIKIVGVSARLVSAAIFKAISDKKIDLHGLGSYGTFTHVDIRDKAGLAYWKL